ncbi:partial arginase, partial [Gammaproteobacteria bacterium]
MTAIRLIGVPMDLGASRRGVDMGPFAVRYTDLRERLERLGHTVDDVGNVAVPFREDAERGAQRGARYLGAITSVCKEIAGLTRSALEQQAMPMLLGGDHSLAAGSIAGAAAFHAARDQRIGVIWIDAHADLNTPGSSRSGNVHGMPLAHVLGHGDTALANVAGVRPAVRAGNGAIVGLRDADDAEKEHLAKWKVRAFTMRSLDERGLRGAMDEAIRIASS